MSQNNSWKIEVPQDYFSRIAAKEYSDDAGMAVIREFAQNSADAGAKVVTFSFLSDTLVVTDDGKGCSEATVRERILTPLGSQKDDDSVGGFGKAKELLYFANPSWVIRTRDVEVTGSFLSVTEFRTGLEHVAGFHARVQLPPALLLAAKRSARHFLSCSERPGVRWVLNGDTVHTVIERSKRAAKDFGFAKAYIDRESRDSMIYLRTGGLLTSMKYGYHGPEVGRVVIEVTGKSFELLTPARDWFRSQAHRSEVEGWLNQLVVNARQTLADREGDEVLFTDFEEVDTREAHHLATKRDVLPTSSGGARIPVKFTGVAGGASAAALARDGEQVGELEVETSAALMAGLQEALRPVKAKRPDGFDMAAMPRLDGVNRLVVHTGNKVRAKVGMKWLAKNVALAARLLAAWTTAVRTVAARNGLPIDAVGFTFAEGVDAEFVRSNGRFGMLLAPMTIEADGEYLAEELLDRAIHETAHLRAENHDETFVLTEVALRRKTRGVYVKGAVNRALRLSAVQVADEE